MRVLAHFLFSLKKGEQRKTKNLSLYTQKRQHFFKKIVWRQFLREVKMGIQGK